MPLVMGSVGVSMVGVGVVGVEAATSGEGEGGSLPFWTADSASSWITAAVERQRFSLGWHTIRSRIQHEQITPGSRRG